MLQDVLALHAEVQEAIESQKPIVVLESTFISHGLPYPENIKTVQDVESLIRKQGAIPATIALHKGKIHIGLDAATLQLIAEAKTIVKASRRDIAYVLSRKMTASTTVAATMFCAHLANLYLFVTGGIGGVHHHGMDSFDISADLTELSKTPITVVCSGAKSILDLPKTLEVLETQGVPVIGYGTDVFPAFYSRSSGIPIFQRLDSAEEVAKLMYCQQQLHMQTGIIIANPIPHEAEISDEEIGPFIEQAKHEAKNLKGKNLTPFLLKRIAELTTGKSLKANIELIKNNAQLGTQIAIAYNQKFIKKIKPNS